MVTAFVVVVIIGIFLKMTVWRTPQIIVGGLYVIAGEDGTYKIAKVLKDDGFAAHVRIYKNVFTAKPDTVDPAELSISVTREDMDTWKSGAKMKLGMGHVPLDRDNFLKSEKTFLMKTIVTEEELAGYYSWRDQK